MSGESGLCLSQGSPSFEVMSRAIQGEASGGVQVKPVRLTNQKVSVF